MSQDTPVIIAAVDQSEILEPVVKRAKHLTDCLNGELIVLHVISGKGSSMVNASYSDMVLGTFDDKELEVEEQIRQLLARRLELIGVEPGCLQLAEGSPAKTVERYLEERDAYMLVVGQPKAMLSSVTTNMAKKAACDVYIVRVS